MLHPDTIEPGTLELLKRLSVMPELSDFFLVEGTALALQIGHRKSIDLDFFTLAPFDEEQLVKALQSHFSMTLNSQNTNTLLCEIENVKVDFIAHQYRQLKKQFHLWEYKVGKLGRYSGYEAKCD